MGARETELLLHKAGTRRFIESDPTEIILIPVVEQMVAGTKKFVDQPALAAQTFKVIWNEQEGIVREVANNGGVRRYPFVIVGNFDATVPINSYWMDGDQKYVIEWVAPPNGYEVKAGGTSHGPNARL